MGLSAPEDNYSPLSNERLPLDVDVFPITAATIRTLNDQALPVGGAPVSSTLQNSEPTFQYKIGPQDILRVTVWDHPELNNPGAITGSAAPTLEGLGPTSSTLVSGTTTDSTARTVNDNGTMFYPFVGLINVAGKTPEEVRSYLAKALARTIRDPQVEVVVASFRSKHVLVTGSVKSPGIVPVTDIPLTLADSIASAGGAVDTADLEDVTVLHNGQIRNINVYRLLYEGAADLNIPLYSSDVVNVPEQRFRKVFVLGEVVKPSSMLMPRGPYSLNEALSDSGGINQTTAKASQIYVIRGSSERPQIYQLNAKSPDALLLADGFLLKPRDIIFVDAAGIVRASRVISQILPSLQALQAGKYLGQ